MGLGGPIGSGRQFMSWISLADLIRVIDFAIGVEKLRGPVNAVAPVPVTNGQFTKALGQVLHRPTLIPMPAFAARLTFGEMADALLLSSTRVVPSRLVETGFQFRYPELPTALQALLG
jgi:uncharacterized protein (TIGR01777 family)